MNAVPTRVKMRSTLFLMLTAILSCDSFKDDFIQRERQVTFSQTEFFTLPGSSIIIDLKSVLKALESANVTITGNPSRGEISRDTFLLKYIPNPEFQEGSDAFTVTVMNNGEIVKTQTMTLTMKQTINEFPCGLNAMEDRVRAEPGSTVSINFLTNDLVCNTDPSSLLFSIHSGPRLGEAEIVGNAIVYTPGSEFTGYDEMVYKITTSGESVSYGIVTITKDWSKRMMKLPVDYLDFFSDIHFVDELTGYLTGRGGFFKTTDGGLHWNVVGPPSLNTDINDSIYYHFAEISFPDANHGFAVFNETVNDGWGSTVVYAGLTSTEDGGASWDVKPIEISGGTVFFTSPTTGFLSELVAIPETGMTATSLIKTTDRGLSWRQVLFNYTDIDTEFTTGDALTVRFINATNGYAYQGKKLFVSTDEGETWQESESNLPIASLTAVADNIVCTKYTTSDQWGSASSIFRLNGTTFQPIANFNYTITNIEFSHSGNLGVAIGNSGPPWQNPAFWINTTEDKGLTWKEHPSWGSSYGYRTAISVPSDRVAYFLIDNRLIRYSHP